MSGITHLKEFSKPVLRGLVDESQKSNYEYLDFVEQFIGDEVIYSTTFAYDVIKRSNHIAAMIGLGAQKPVVDRHATATVMGEIAHFAISEIITIEELYEIAQARNDASKSAMVDKLVNKGIDLLDYLKLRVRVEKLKALAIGYNEYDDNNVKVKLDYGIPAEHKHALVGAEAWSNANKDVIGDLLGWVATYQRNNGKKPEAMLITRKVLNALTENTLLIAEAGRPDGAKRISMVELEEVLTRYGLPRLIVVEETETSVRNIDSGEDEIISVFPENRVVLVSEGAGKFLTGPNPDDDNFAPVVVLDAYDERNPIRSIIAASHSGFAILENPNLVFHADVIEGE